MSAQTAWWWMPCCYGRNSGVCLCPASWSAATGNGTVKDSLQLALLRARDSGVAVLRASRCNSGQVLLREDDVFAAASGLTPAKARVALMLQLLGAGVGNGAL